jgi:hypothetical protein
MAAKSISYYSELSSPSLFFPHRRYFLVLSRLTLHLCFSLVNKKTGWVGLEDSGLLDIYLGSEHPDADNGLDITLVLENADEKDRESFFKLKKVDVDISGFDIKIRQSAHPIRNWLAQGAVRSFMEIKIKEVVSQKLFSSHFSAKTDQFALRFPSFYFSFS